MMNPLLRLLPLLALTVASLSAAGTDRFDAVRRADDARVDAITSGSRAKLDAIVSNDLHYVHSTGWVNNKALYVDAIVSGHLKYYSVVYEERTFSEAAPDIVLMSGRSHIRASNDGPVADHYLSFLAVYRREKGVWRFLAWQSCGLPDPKH